MKALTGQQASLSVCSNQDTRTGECDLAAGERRADNERASRLRRRNAADPPNPQAARIGSQREIIESGHPAFAIALEGFAGEPAAIYVDLAGAAFCGVVILIRASRPGHGARPVVLHGIAPHLKAMLGNVGWDGTLDLVLHERDSSIPPQSGRVTGGGCMAAPRLVPGGPGRLGYSTMVAPSAAPGLKLERRR
jgi:hypothetical protein